MNGKDMIFWVVVLAVLVSGVCVAMPYWDKFWLGFDVESAAIYGTKNSIAETRRFLTKKMVESGQRFRGEDFYIEKNPGKAICDR